MLKCILFLLSEEYEKEVGIYREMISEGLEQAGVQAEFFSIGNEDTFHLKDMDKDYTLAVTDKTSVFHKLYQEGYYIIALYHDGNREEDFSGVRYAVEDLPAVEYCSYEEAFCRLAGIPWDILETERMKVRETMPRDVDEFYRIYRDPSITQYMEDLYPNREQEMEYIKAYVKQVYEFYGFGLWTVLHKESGRVIGRAGLNVREGYDIPELGFVIDAEFQGQGYAFEVCSAILKYAGEKLEFPDVQAFVDGNNQCSIHLLEKLGFAFDREVDLDRHYHRYVKNLKNSLQNPDLT